MIRAVQESTNDYAVISGTSVDTHVRGRTEVRFDFANLHNANAVLVEIQQSDDDSTYSTYLDETNIRVTAESAAPKYVAVRSPWKRYYRARVKAVTGGSQGVIECQVSRMDYIQTGIIEGKDVWGPEAEYAEEILDEATQDHFNSALKTFTCVAPGGRELSLLGVTPLPCVSVSSITVVDSAGTSHSSGYTGYIFLLDGGHTLRLDDDCADVFYQGDGRENLTLVGYFGRATTAVPTPIVQACQRIASMETQTSGEKLGTFEMIKIDGYTRQLSTRVEREYQVTGDPHVDRVLEDYRNPLANVSLGAV